MIVPPFIVFSLFEEPFAKTYAPGRGGVPPEAFSCLHLHLALGPYYKLFPLFVLFCSRSVENPSFLVSTLPQIFPLFFLRCYLGPCFPPFFRAPSRFPATSGWTGFSRFHVLFSFVHSLEPSYHCLKLGLSFPQLFFPLSAPRSSSAWRFVLLCAGDVDPGPSVSLASLGACWVACVYLR